jgi:Flp pilus assembly protein CpaB
MVGSLLLFLVVGRGGKSSSTTTATQHVATAPVVTTTVAPGSVVFPATPPTTIIQFKIPANETGVALPMDYFAGGGGFVRPGDSINIYEVTNKDCATPAAMATVKLIQSNVKVLEVLGAAPATTGTPSAYLLALTPQEAEKVIFGAKFESLYLTLTTDATPPQATTGITCKNAL